MDYREAPGRQVEELGGSYALRRPRKGEAAALSALSLRSKAQWGYDEAFMAACVDELTWSEAELETAIAWVAENADGDAVGFCAFSLEGGTAEVEAFFVDPDAMGQGIGQALWQKAEDALSARGVECIGLDADPNAAPFYARMGAQTVGQSASGSIAGRMLPRMVCQIKSRKVPLKV